MKLVYSLFISGILHLLFLFLAFLFISSCSSKQTVECVQLELQKFTVINVDEDVCTSELALMVYKGIDANCNSVLDNFEVISSEMECFK